VRYYSSISKRDKEVAEKDLLAARAELNKLSNERASTAGRVAELQARLEEKIRDCSALTNKERSLSGELAKKQEEWRKSFSELEERLRSEIAESAKSRTIVAALTQKRQRLFSALSNALAELRSNRRELSELKGQIDLTVKRLDAVMAEESVRVREFAEVKAVMSSVRDATESKLNVLEVVKSSQVNLTTPLQALESQLVSERDERTRVSDDPWWDGDANGGGGGGVQNARGFSDSPSRLPQLESPTRMLLARKSPVGDEGGVHLPPVEEGKGRGGGGGGKRVVRKEDGGGRGGDEAKRAIKERREREIAEAANEKRGHGRGGRAL
jgi:hypothetical protein